jgi:two-component system, sensor histidine kinase PdtaS
MKSGYSIRHLPTFRLLLAILEIILLQVAQAQQTGSSEANTIIKQLRSGKADTPKVHMLLRLSTIYLNKTLNPIRDMDSALMLAGQALDLAQRLEFDSGEGDAIFLKGRIYIKQQNTVKLHQMLGNASSKNRIKLLLELGKSMLRTTYLQKGNRDSAIIFFQEAGRLSDRIGNQKLKEESQCLLGIVYLLNGNWQQGKAYFTQVIEARQRAKDKAGEINALLRLATTVFCDNCTENITALTRALELSREIGDQSLEALIRLQIGYKHLNDGNAKQAEEEAMAALNIQKAIGYSAIYHAYKALAMQSVYYSPSDYGYLSNAYYLLSDIGQNKGDLNQKLFYILEVVDNVEKSGMLEELDYTYFRLGNAYWELGQFDKSMEYHKQSAAISHQKGELIPVETARRMTAALLKQGKVREALLLLHDIVDKKLLCSVEDKIAIAQSLGSCYNALKQYRLAEEYYLESVAWSKQSPLYFQFLAYRGIARFYVTNAQYSRAEPYLRLLLKASRQQILPNYLIEIHLMWFKVDSARRNYPEAIRHYQLYKALQDSIFNETKSKQIAQLSIQYETEKNQHEITVLNQKNQLAQSRLERSQLVKNLTIGGIAFLFIIIGLLYRQYRHKQQNNKVILHKNEQLQHYLTEKEWLLKEIHHRVKNNLQIVMSLLNSQLAYIENDVALTAIHDSQHRIHAMSLIHKKLYNSENVSSIDMSFYIRELVSYLADSFNTGQRIRFEFNIDPLEMDVSQAVPLGLILNEAITNSIKYAFPNNKEGAIIISLSKTGLHHYLLTISDNGIGMPGHVKNKKPGSLGMSLMAGLSEDLDGTFSIENNNGTLIKISFVLDISVKRTDTLASSLITNN